MARTKQTPRLSEMTAKEKKAHDKKARDHRADLHAKCLASILKDRKTTQGGKTHCKQLVTQASWIHTIHEIKHSSAVLIY